VDVKRRGLSTKMQTKLLNERKKKKENVVDATKAYPIVTENAKINAETCKRLLEYYRNIHMQITFKIYVS